MIKPQLGIVSAVFTAALLFFAAPGAVGPVSAQGALEEVVVTARKREESLLDVPLALSAIGSADIEAKGLVNFKDIVDFTPGFFFSEVSVGRGDRSNRILVVRGMRINTENDHQQAATVFVDGVPMLGSAIAGLEDAERIEIVRGPQSAYFGRSTLSGAVNFVTKTPSDEFTGKVTAEGAKFGESNFGLQVEGPITDTLSYRLSGSQWQTDGQYPLGNDSSITLGARKTTSFAGTLHFHPNDQFSAKLRIHNWRDDDGPGASFAYGLGNGESNFNCNPPGSTLNTRNGGPNNYICGVAPFPTGSQIQADTVLTPDKRRLLSGVGDPGFSLDSAFTPPFLDGFGLERLAKQASLIMDYEFANGLTLTSSTAVHSNEWMALDDLDRRNSAALPGTPGPAQDVTLLNSRDLEDFSQEIRLSSSPDNRLRWMIGASYFDFEGVRTSGFKVFGAIRSFSFGNVFDNTTTGLFGSVEYDITDKVTVSVEARRQKDEVSEARTSGAESASGTFNSTTPRIIVDFKPNDDLTFYATYGEGTRPGAFNVNLLGQPQSVLDQLATIGIGASVPEEEIQNLEAGVKGTFLDGRAQASLSIYTADWDAQSATGRQVTLPDNSLSFISGNVIAGVIELQGVEVEGIWAASDNFTVEGTFSYNEAVYKDYNACGDCVFIMGTTDITGLNKIKSRTPETQGSLSGTYQRQLNDTYEWFVRGDYIHQGSRFATDANVLETGSSNRFNLRAGIESENLRLEAYSKNLFDDDTLPNYQLLLDFAYFGANRVITSGLPEKRTYGIRAIYTF